MRTKQGINDLIKGIMIEGRVNVTNLEKTADRIIEALTEENNLIIPNVIHWVAIEDDMPEFNNWVVAHTKDGANHIAYFDEKRNEWVANSKFGDKITHWREEPKPPCV